MSVRMMTRVWESAQKTATHKLVLLAFADFSNDDGISWPSVNTVAKKTQLSRRQTQRIIHELVEEGYLAVVDDPVHHRTATYELRGDKLTPLPDSGVTSEQSGVTSATRRGDKSDKPLHIKEPSLEPSDEPLGNRLERRYREQKPSVA